MKCQSAVGFFVALLMVLGGCDGGAEKSIPRGDPAEILAYWVGKWEFKGQDVVSGKAPQQQVGSVVYRWKEKVKSIEGAGTVKYGVGPATPQNSDQEFDPALGVFIWRWREGGVERVIHRRYDPATGTYHDKGGLRGRCSRRKRGGLDADHGA